MRLPTTAPHPAPRSQRGAILVVALMFLVLLTIVGVSSISSTTLEEKMAGNARDQQIAFQAAESALRDAEIDLELLLGNLAAGTRDPMSIAANFATNCLTPIPPLAGPYTLTAFTNGVCATTDFRVQIITAAGWNWTDANRTVLYGTYTGQAAVAPLIGVASQPRYVIEYMSEKDENVPTPLTRYFRISARGWGANANSVVTLQSVYKMPMP